MSTIWILKHHKCPFCFGKLHRLGRIFSDWDSGYDKAHTVCLSCGIHQITNIRKISVRDDNQSRIYTKSVKLYGGKSYV